MLLGSSNVRSIILLILSLTHLVNALADLRPDDFRQEGVTVLTSDNFEDTIKKNKYVLVQFYAPWCGHCKQFRTEYLKAAKTLTERKAHPTNPLDVQFAVVDATVETKLAELYGVRGYPLLKFFHNGRDMEYGGGRMAESIVAWIEKKAGPSLIDLRTAEEVSVFFDEKARDSTPSGTDMLIGGGIIVAFTADPEKIAILEDVSVTMDDMFFGIAPPSVQNEVIPSSLIESSQATLDEENDKLQVPRVSLSQDVIYMRYPFDSGHAVAPIVNGESLKLGYNHPEYTERVGDDIRFFIAIHMLPNVNTFTGENAAMIFNDPRPLLVFFRDEARETVSQKYASEIKTQTRLIEDAMPNLATKYKQDFVVVLSGAEQPMEMRFMDYVTADYEDLPCVRIIKNPTDSMVKYKLPISIPSETEDKDLSYLNNALAITPQKIEQFTESFLIGDAEPHIKSQPIPKKNPMDQQSVFQLVGDHFLQVVQSKNTLVLYMAPWCGHCKKLEPIYRELSAKYNIPNSNVLISSFDNTANDVPLEVDDIIQGYPTLKLYLKSPTKSVHYAGDRHLETLIEFIESNVEHTMEGREEL